jgi:formylglycine-generating enzyme required for sulfatase activity
MNREITNSIGMKLVLIPRGTFMMGSPDSEDEIYQDQFQNEFRHEVTITKDFYLGIFPVTQSQYKNLMGNNPSYFQGAKVSKQREDRPVEKVSWDEATEFCMKLSDLPEEKKAGRVYCLPTEAQWEYACRAGSTKAYSFGENSESLGDYAWFDENSKRQTHPVGKKMPNAWGLYDMHGNVGEWCSDRYGKYPEGSVIDPTGPKEGSGHVLRGGSWDCGDTDCRSAYRDGDFPSGRDRSSGFRVALSSQEILQ